MLACLPWWLLAPATLALFLCAAVGALAVGLGATRAYDRGYRDGWQAFLEPKDEP